MFGPTADAIERCYRELADADDGGDFTTSSPDDPVQNYGPVSQCSVVVYSTKPQFLFRHCSPLISDGRLALIGRYGFPAINRELLINMLTGRRCLFLGDADPPDLLLYSWLRAQLEIEWFGISDSFLAKSGAERLNGVTIPMSRIEVHAIQDIQRLSPDFTALLGPTCSQLLDTGRKLEIEGALAVSTTDVSEWFAHTL